MSFKKTITFIVILGILVGIAYIMNRSPQKTEQETALFPAFVPEKANYIRINGPTNKLTLTKDADIWTVVEEENLQADTEQVKQALQTISEIKKENIVSRNPSKQKIFQVDPNNTFEIEIKGEGDEILAHLYIGKNGPDFMSTYIRRPDSEEVILHRGFHLRSGFDKSTDAWLDKSITKFNDEDLDRIEFDRPDQPFSIRREDGKWRMTTPEESGVKEEMVNKMVFALTALRAIKLQRLKPDQSLKEFDLDDPPFSIKTSLLDGTTQTILVSKLQEKTDQYYIMISDLDIVYTVAKNAIDKLDKPWQELKKEEPPPDPTPSPEPVPPPEPAEGPKPKNTQEKESLPEKIH